MAGDDKRSWLAPSAIIGVASLVLTALGLYINSRGDDGSDGGVAAYQEQVRAACRTILVVANLDRALSVDSRGLLDKSRIVTAATENLEATKLQFDLVARLDTPESLQAAKGRVQPGIDRYLAFAGCIEMPETGPMRPRGEALTWAFSERRVRRGGFRDSLFGRDLIARIDRSLPPRPTPAQYEAVVVENQRTILPAGVEINSAMTELAGGECRVA